jgi:hypothetical protein
VEETVKLQRCTRATVLREDQVKPSEQIYWRPTFEGTER